MDFKQIQSQLNQQISLLNQKVNAFFNFKNFKNLTLGEQISYGIIGGGLFLILVSIILFIV